MEMPDAVRARHDGGRGLRCSGEGQETTPEQLSLRSNNRGQHWRTEGIEEVGYSVEVPLVFAVEVIGRELVDWQEDADRFPDASDALETALRERGWPSAAIALDDAALAGPVLERHTDDLLLVWLGDLDTGARPGWVINTVTSCELDGDVVRMAGAARRAGIPVRYQDV